MNPELTGLQIRVAVPEDAEVVLAHLHALYAHPDPLMIPKQPDEVKIGLEDQRKMLASFATSPNSLFLIALEGERVVANLDLKGHRYRAVAHVAELGIAIQADWRGRGLGGRLVGEAMAWAEANPIIRRIELKVYTDNAPAIALYQRFGFVTEGRRKGLVLYQGRYCDDLIMARYFERD